MENKKCRDVVILILLSRSVIQPKHRPVSFFVQLSILAQLFEVSL